MRIAISLVHPHRLVRIQRGCLLFLEHFLALQTGNQASENQDDNNYEHPPDEGFPAE